MTRLRDEAAADDRRRSTVVAVRDYQAQTRDDSPTARRRRSTCPTSDVLAFELDGGQPRHRAPERDGAEDQVLLRRARADREGEPLAAAEARAAATMKKLADAFVAIAT